MHTWALELDSLNHDSASDSAMCIALGTLANFSKIQFPQLLNEETITHLTEWLIGLK